MILSVVFLIFLLRYYESTLQRDGDSRFDKDSIT